jgi:Ribosomal protein L7/L12 C-terminal domain
LKIEDGIEALLRNGKKIEAIKVYRERTGLGLREAKDAVEEIEKAILPPLAPGTRKGCMTILALLLLVGAGLLL